MLNAANEVAVHAFLARQLSFGGIARVIGGCLEQLPARSVRHFSDLYGADEEARRVAGELVCAEASTARTPPAADPA